MHSKGVEPISSESESDILSIELRVQKDTNIKHGWQFCADTTYINLASFEELTLIFLNDQFFQIKNIRIHHLGDWNCSFIWYFNECDYI